MTYRAAFGIFSPQRGEMLQRDRGGARGAQEGGKHTPSALRATPLCLTASPPQGGEKIGAGGISPRQ